MPSSKNSPGPHDRRIMYDDDGNPLPRPKCIQLTRLGVRCKRDALGKTKLCKIHGNLAKANMATLGNTPADDPNREAHRQRRAQSKNPDAMPDTQVKDLVEAGITTQAKRRAAEFVISEQSRDALRRLGKAYDPNLDPKRVLLDNVESAWRQRQVWEAMLAQIPDDDWTHLGQTPIPGVPATAKGTRIEVIQKHLSEATKVSMRVSKLAIDAGIEERIVRLAEEQSALIADTVRTALIAGIAMLAKAGMITKEQEALAIDSAVAGAANHLRQLATGLDADGNSITSHAPPEIYEGIAKEVN